MQLVQNTEIQLQYAGEQTSDDIYIPPMKPEGLAQGCILQWLFILHSLSADSQVKMRAIIQHLVERKLDIFQPK